MVWPRRRVFQDAHPGRARRTPREHSAAVVGDTRSALHPPQPAVGRRADVARVVHRAQKSGGAALVPLVLDLLRPVDAEFLRARRQSVLRPHRQHRVLRRRVRVAAAAVGRRAAKPCRVRLHGVRSALGLSAAPRVHADAPVRRCSLRDDCLEKLDRCCRGGPLVRRWCSHSGARVAAHADSASAWPARSRPPARTWWSTSRT